MENLLKTLKQIFCGPTREICALYFCPACMAQQIRGAINKGINIRGCKENLEGTCFTLEGENEEFIQHIETTNLMFRGVSIKADSENLIINLELFCEECRGLVSIPILFDWADIEPNP